MARCPPCHGPTAQTYARRRLTGTDVRDPAAGVGRTCCCSSRRRGRRPRQRCSTQGSSGSRPRKSCKTEAAPTPRGSRALAGRDPRWPLDIAERSADPARRSVGGAGRQLAYVVGGFDAVGRTAAVQRLNLPPAAGVPPPMPEPLNHMSAVAYGGDLYVLGGYTQPGDTSTGAVHDFWRFDPAPGNGARCRRAALPGRRRRGGARPSGCTSRAGAATRSRRSRRWRSSISRPAVVARASASSRPRARRGGRRRRGGVVDGRPRARTGQLH